MFTHLSLCGLLALSLVLTTTEKTTNSPSRFFSLQISADGGRPTTGHPLPAVPANRAFSAETAPCISGIINTYTPVTGLGCDNSVLQVGSTAGLAAGDKVLIVQMQVNQVDLSNTAAFGTLLDTTRIGNYEFNRVQSLSGNQVQLQFKLTRPYDFTGKVQLVRVPEYTDIAVCNLTCVPWNGATGGILVFSVSGTLTLDGNIDVSQRGFRGGPVETQIIPWVFGEQQYFYPPNTQLSSAKGEGIVFIPTDHSFGRGRAANGGGGGNAHNAGGGGGGNAGAGGNGGREITNLPAFPTPNTDGINGERYFYLNRNKILLGGAGGTGHANDQLGTAGGRGGGIVLIQAGTIVANNRQILANGENIVGGANFNDGQGGGGAGGTIALQTQQLIGALTCDLRGGTGGSNPYVPAFQLHGPGGGGGGGKLLLSQNFPSLSSNLNGGLNGLSSQGYTNGALPGLPGRLLSGLVMPEGTEPAEPTWSVSLVAPACGSGGGVGSITVVQPAVASYRLNNGAWQPSPIFSGLASGTYQVQAQSIGGCLYDTTVVLAGGVPVSLALLQTIAATCIAGGQLEVAGSTGTPPYEYQVDGGAWQPLGLFTGLPAGPHTATVRDAASCTQTASYTIPAPPAVTLTLVNVQTAPCNGTGQLDVAGSAGTPPYQFSIDGGPWQAGGSFSNLPAGAHTVAVQDAAGCQSSSSYTVPAAPAATDTLLALQAATCALGGQASLDGLGGTPPYSFQLDGGAWQASGVFAGLSAGAHTYTVRDQAGCEASGNFTINLNSTLYDSLLLLQGPSCNAGGQLSVTAAGGLAPYEFALNGGAWQASGQFSGLPAGAHTIAVRDASGCSDSTTYTLPAPLAVADSLLDLSPAGCTTGGTLSVTAISGLAPFEFQLDGGAWQPGGSFIDLPPGPHQLVLRDAAGCTESNVYNIAALPAVDDSLIQLQAATCVAGGTLTVAGQSGTPPYEFQLGGGGWQAAGTFSGLAAGTYAVAVRDAAGCTVSADYTVPAPPPLNDPLVQLTSATCLIGADLQVTGSAGTPPYEYALNGSGWQSGAAFTDLAPGSHFVAVRDAAGCTDSTSFTVAAPAGLSLSIDQVNAATCLADGAIDVSGLAGQPPYQFALDGGAWQSGSTFSAVAAGAHTVAIQDAAGCTFSEPFVIDAAPPVALVLQSLQHATCLAGGQLEAAASGGTGPFEYSLNGSAWQAGGSFANLPVGSQQVVIRDAAGCTDTASYFVSPPPALGDSLLTLTIATCVNGAQLEVAALGGTAPFQFQLDGGAWQSSGAFSNVPAGNHTLVLTDAAGCADTSSYAVGSTADVSISLTQLQNATCIAGGTLEIAGVSGTPPYQFALDGGPWQPGGQFSNLPAGPHTATVQDAAGCTFLENYVIDSAPAVADTLISLQDASCLAGGTLTVAATGGTAPFEYQLNAGAWQPGGSFSNLPAGTYSLTLRDAAGCTVTATYEVPGAPAVTDSLVMLVDEACGALGALTVTASGGTPPFLFSLDSGPWLNAGSFTDLPAGSYTLAIQDNAGCTASSVYTVENAPQPPAPSIALLPGCPTGTLTANQPSASGFRLDGGPWQSQAVFSGLAAGNYLLEVQYPGGCLFDTLLTLPAAPAVQQTLLQIGPASCTAGGQLTVAGQSGTPPFQYALGTGGWQASGVFAGLPAGDYSVTVQDAAGCTAIAAYTIPAPPPVLLELEELVHPDCRTTAGAITVAATGGIGAISYQIDAGVGQADGQFDDLSVGNYSITATDQEGCTAVLQVAIQDLSGDTSLTYESVTIFEGTYYRLPDGRETARPDEYIFRYQNAAGCDSTHIIELKILPRNVYVPNVFAPESNGRNQVFTVYANEALQLVRRLAVYDRWGELVFERRDLAPNDELRGWDGVFRGRPVSPGAYVWLAELEFVDGVQATISGDVTVLR